MSGAGGVSGLRNQRIYGQHGSNHAPRGGDPAIPDNAILVGIDPRVPFINGANAAPTAKVPNPSPLHFFFVLGEPNECEYSGWGATVDPMTGAVTPGGDPTATSIVTYMPHVIEFCGDVTGVNPGDVVFVLPLEYRYATDKPGGRHDDAGNYTPFRIYSTGEFVWGVP